MDRVGHQKMMTKAAGFDLELLAIKLLVAGDRRQNNKRCGLQLRHLSYGIRRGHQQAIINVG